MGTHPIFESDFDCLTDGNGGSQGTPQEADLGQEAKAEPTSAQLDPLPYWKHHQVQRQAPSLAPYQDWFVNYSRTNPTKIRPVRIPLALCVLFCPLCSNKHTSEKK